MIKVITMMKRKEGLRLEEFNQYWYEKHASLARKVIPKEVAPKQYVHDYPVAFAEDWVPAFDGIEWLCFDNVQSLIGWNEWFMSEGAEILHEDELNFVDPGTRVAMVVEEKVIIPERKGAGGERAGGKGTNVVKLMAMLKRKDGMSPEEFGKHWYEDHGPMAARIIPETVRIRRYVQNHAVRLIEDQEPRFDGIVEFCLEGLDSLDAWMAFYASNEGKIIRDDEVRFIDMSKIIVVLVEERVIPQIASKT